MKEPKTLFDTWLRNVALCDRIVDIDDVEKLYINVKEAAYQQGYKQGDNDGYAQAVADAARKEQGETE